MSVNRQRKQQRQRSIAWKPTFMLMCIAVIMYLALGYKHTQDLRNIPLERGDIATIGPQLNVAIVYDRRLNIKTDSSHSLNLGDQFIEGARLAVREANKKGFSLKGSSLNHTLNMIPMGYSSAKESDEIAMKIAKDSSYIAVIGHMDSQTSLSAAVFYEQAGLLYISPFSTLTSLTGHGFSRLIRTLPNSTQYAHYVGDAIRNILPEADEDEPYKIGILYNRDVELEYKDEFVQLSRYMIEYNRKCDFIDFLSRRIAEEKLDPQMTLTQYLKAFPETSYKAEIKAIVIESYTQKHALVAMDWTLADLEREKMIDTNATLKKIIQKYDNRRHINLVFSDSYHSDDTDFTKMIAENANKRVDLLILCDYISPRSSTLIDQLRHQGITIPIIAGDDFDVTAQEMHDMIGESANNMYIITAFDDEEHRAFAKHIKAAGDLSIPNTFDSMQGYEAITLLAQAIRTMESPNPQALATGMRYSQREWQGVLYKYRFSPDGDVWGRHLSLHRYSNRKFEEIDLTK